MRGPADARRWASCLGKDFAIRSREKEPPENETTKRLSDSECDTLEMPSQQPTAQATSEESDTEIEPLRLQLQESKAREQALKEELVEKVYKTGELHTNLLDELEEQILITIGQQGGSCNKFDLECHLGRNLHEKGKQQINKVTLDRHLSKLKEKGYIENNEDSRSIYEQVAYSLTDKGRDYLIDNKLL